MNDIYTGQPTGVPDLPNQSTAPPQPTHTVERGENFWVIAQSTLRDAYGREPSTAEIQAYWQQLMAANADRLEHPGNFDLIYPDQEFVLPDIPPPAADGDGGPDGNGEADPGNGQVSRQQAATDTDTALEKLEAAEAMDIPPGLEHEKEASVGYARQEVFDAIQTEIEAGLREFLQQNPDATPAQIEAKTDELRSGIQSRSERAAEFDDRSMEFRTQQAINTVSAEQHGYNLDNVAPGTRIQDGPYTDEHGPFEPNATIEGPDGRTYRIDANGHIANGPIPVDGDSRGNARYEVYENGVPTGQSWALPPPEPRPDTEPTPSEDNPVGRVADEPANNRERSDLAAHNYYEASVSDSPQTEQARQAFIQSVRAELATGTSLSEIQERYDNDPYLNAAIREAAYGV